MITVLFFLCSHPVPRWEDELICWEPGICYPRVVNLGPFDPAPAPKDWDTRPFVAPSTAPPYP